MSSSSSLREARAAVSSDAFSVRDLVSWNPFRYAQSIRMSRAPTKSSNSGNSNEETESDCEDFAIKYDHHWILILNGSYKGYFDWIPIHLRTGIWSFMAILYFRTLWCLVVLLILNDLLYNTNRSTDRALEEDGTHTCAVSSSVNEIASVMHQQYCYSSSITITNALHYIVRRYWIQNASTILQTPPVMILSSSFYYNTIVAAYMSYICYSIIAHSPLSYGAWITYTVQSWTILWLRHLLYSLSGLFDSSTTDTTTSILHTSNNNFVVMAELIRFPCAVAHTMTFIVWNFILVPYILCIALRNDPKRRRDFIRFCTNFRLFNLHGMNILFCVANVWYFNSKTNGTAGTRTFEMADLYLSGISAFIYFTFYLCILDRIGIHLYPIFSPRHSNTVVFIVWTSVILLYILVYHLWQYVITI
jgi:hypothetical protein